MLNLLPAVFGLLLILVVSKLTTATVALLTLRELRGDTSTLSAVLKKAAGRIPRLFGLDLKVLALALAPLAIIVLTAVTEPLLLILVLPAAAVVFLAALPVYFLAYVVASIGPAQPSLRYSYRLIRNRFWAAFGRTLLLFALLFGVGSVFEAATALSGVSWIVADLVNGAASAVTAVLFSIAIAILYLDLGGETDKEPETESGST